MMIIIITIIIIIIITGINKQVSKATNTPQHITLTAFLIFSWFTESAG